MAKPPPDTRTYAEKLKDPKWDKVRFKVLTENNWTCEECHLLNPTCGLQVHHIIYLTGVQPWDHPMEVLMCLCEKCHKERQPVEQQFFYKVALAIRYKSIKELMEMPVWWMFETKPLYEKEK